MTSSTKPSAATASSRLRRAIPLLALGGLLGTVRPAISPAYADLPRPPKFTTESSSQMASQMAAFAQREWLEPVLENLKRNAKADPNLVGLLNRMRLQTRVYPDESGPNAFAYEDAAGRPIVTVDLLFLISAMQVADVAGLALTGRSDAAPIIASAMATYQNALQHPVAGVVPEFSFSYRTIDNPTLRMMTEPMAQAVFLAAVTWAILHEVGHHVLGQVARLEALRDAGVKMSMADARGLETEADGWAFDAMVRLGYGLAPLGAQLAALAAVQRQNVAAGRDRPELASDHPSFRSRFNNLSRHGDVKAPPQGPWMVILYFSVGGQGSLELATLVIPRDPATDAVYAFERNTFLAYEWKDGQVHLYGRAGNVRQEVVVLEPNALRPKMLFRTVNADGTVSAETTQGFQTDFAFYQTTTIRQGLTVADAMEFKPRQWLLDTVSRITTSVDTLSSVELSFVKHLRETRRVVIENARGAISDAAAQEDFKKSTDLYFSEIKAALGDAKYDQWRALVAGDPAYSILVEKGHELKLVH